MKIKTLIENYLMEQSLVEDCVLNENSLTLFTKFILNFVNKVKLQDDIIKIFNFYNIIETKYKIVDVNESLCDFIIIDSDNYLIELYLSKNWSIDTWFKITDKVNNSYIMITHYSLCPNIDNYLIQFNLYFNKIYMGTYKLYDDIEMDWKINTKYITNEDVKIRNNFIKNDYDNWKNCLSIFFQLFDINYEIVNHLEIIN